MRLAHYFVSMVSIRTLQEDKTASTNSSTGSVPTEVLRPEDENYDLDLPPYPWAFPAFQCFHLDEEIWFSMSATTNQSLTAKPMSKDTSVNSTTLIVLSDEQMRSSASCSQITLMMTSMWLGTSKYSRHQALM